MTVLVTASREIVTGLRLGSPARAAPSGPADGGAGGGRNDDRSSVKGQGPTEGAAWSGPVVDAAPKGRGGTGADGVAAPRDST